LSARRGLVSRRADQFDGHVACHGVGIHADTAIIAIVIVIVVIVFIVVVNIVVVIDATLSPHSLHGRRRRDIVVRQRSDIVADARV
jgi:hypothetical protein